MQYSEASKYANLYSLIHSLECLEKAYSRGIVLDSEYVKECSKLINLCLVFRKSNAAEFDAFLNVRIYPFRMNVRIVCWLHNV